MAILPFQNLPTSSAEGASNTPSNIVAWVKELAAAQDRADQQKQKDTAQALGIAWERPAGDNRSAQYIVEHSPLLKNLGNQEGIRDMLKEQVGDYENDSDAAFRAEQVLQHIEAFDRNGDRIASPDIGNDRIDGVTPNDQVTHDSEAGRLMDFGKDGFESLKGNLQDLGSAWADPAAKEKAKELGIVWERPEGDDRSASDIIAQTPVLANLGNQSGVKDMLKDRVGDYDTDADAAYRAAQVMEHIEGFDGDGKAITGKDVGNEKVDGFTKGGDARHGTEAGRLQDFGKYGFDSLKGELPDRVGAGNDDAAKARADALGIDWTRASDDHRTAQEIIDGDPLLKNLENKSGVKDSLKDQVGDYEVDADAAYRASKVLEHIERYNANGEAQVGKDVANGSIDGFTSSDEALNGSEAGRLQDFSKYGFEALKGDLDKLPEKTNSENAQEQASALGIEWVRPEGDDRSARDILNDSPLLANLGNQSGVKDMLKERVGDYETDPDAAYRAMQVLEHIEQRNSDGDKTSYPNDVGNDTIDGFTNSGEARAGTEAGRLQDFGKYGFSHLKGELTDRSGIEAPAKVEIANEDEARKQAAALGIEWELAPDDKRSAKDILDSSPLLRDLGNQENIRDGLKERVGDFEHDADAAYRATQVLEQIEMFDASGTTLNDKNVGNGSIDGVTANDQVEHGTEAGRLKDFGKYGFENLKGALPDRSAVGSDETARAEAEAVDIQWTRPQDDTRSAQEIIEQTPLLADLGNQSGVRELLKDRVGDFDTDPDAAFRAAQVLERIEKYDASGKALAGDDVDNGKVDGFTNSGEAKPDTEAGRLQDFGKYGYATLKSGTDAGSKYDDYLKKNPDADDTSKQLVEYASLLDKNFDTINEATGGGEFLTVEKIQQFKQDYPGLDPELTAALDFWSNPGSFQMLETSVDKMRYPADGLLAKKDISSWIDNAPKDAQGAAAFILGTANGNAVAGVDPQAIDSEIFEHPEKYSTEEKAAVLKDLQEAHDLVVMGMQSGMWDKDHVVKKLGDRAGVGSDPEQILKEIDQHIETLSADPDVVSFMNDTAAHSLTDLMDQYPELKQTLQKTYDEDIKTGAALDKLLDGDKPPTQSEALASFLQTGKSIQAALGIDDMDALHTAVNNSAHGAELNDYYEKSIVSGDRYKELLKEYPVEQAMSNFSMEAALFNAALDPTFTSSFGEQLNDNFNTITQENLFKDATFEDLEKAYGVNGGEELDEDKLNKLIDGVMESNPEVLVNADGTMPSRDQLLAGFRTEWDFFRQGTKILKTTDMLGPDSSAKDAYTKGVFHGVSGLLLAGVTISRGITASGTMTDKQKVDIATGSIQTTGFITEGGLKNYQAYLTSAGVDPELIKDPKNFTQYLQKNAGKIADSVSGVGGLAGIAASAYGIFDSVNLIRSGDTVNGALGITSNSLGLMAGTAGVVESGLGALGMTVPRLIPLMAGGLGFAAGVVSAATIIVTVALQESKESSFQNDYADLLGDYLEKYKIDGKTA